MNSQPLQLSPAERQLLAEYERLHEAWRVASATADQLDACCCGGDPQGMQEALDQRLAADRLHRQAMQLVRSKPI